jgi:hypothetical protein
VRDVTSAPGRGRFIALEGPDGVGKTTLAGLLAPLRYADAVAALPGGPPGPGALVCVAKRQVSATSAYAERAMGRLAGVLWGSGDSRDLPDAFWVHAQAAWFAAHTATVLEPLLAAGWDVLVDGWFYKFHGQLLEQGYRQDELDVIFARTRTPDGVLLLTADLAGIHRRRAGGFRPTELGMFAGDGELGADTFVAYQQRGLRRLRDYAARLDWATVELAVDTGPARSAAVVAPVLARLRAAGGVTGPGRA